MRTTIPVPLVIALALVLTTVGCGNSKATTNDASRPGNRGHSPSAHVVETEHGRSAGKVRHTPDLLVVSGHVLPEPTRNRISRLPSVNATARLSVGSYEIDGTPLTIGAVDPGSYRRFAPADTAGNSEVWRSVASGHIVVSPSLAENLEVLPGTALEFADKGLRLYVAGVAAGVPTIDAMVNGRRGKQLHIEPHNALLISADRAGRDELITSIGRLLPPGTRIDQLTGNAASIGTRFVARLPTGVADHDLGSFSYEYFPDGSVRPDPRWVAANIRTEPVPILGRVTCHRLMLPQLRAAFEEIVRRGLAGSIDPGEYGGCYVPRFIDRDPSRSLSLHTWGIAVDLNVSGNHLGTVGKIDRRVVDIFKRWGFAWGGDWDRPDPMHFELVRFIHR